MFSTFNSNTKVYVDSPNAAWASTAILQNTKRALTCANIGDVLLRANYTQPLSIEGEPIRACVRKRGIQNVSDKLQSILSRCEHQCCSPETRKKLLVGLSSAIEKHVASYVYPRALSAYKKAIEVVLKELRCMLGPGETVHFASALLESITPWISKVKELADEMDVDSSCSHPEKASLTPLPSPFPTLLKIHSATREQGFAILFSRTQLMNVKATQHRKERLTASEAGQFAQMAESKILKHMHRDMRQQPVPPTPEAVEREYCARVNAKEDKCSVMRNFVRKVRKFHEYVKNVVTRMMKKFKNVTTQRETAARRSTPAEDTNRIPASPSEQTFRLKRQSFRSQLAYAIFNTNLSFSVAENQGVAILSPQHIQDVARMLEADIIARLETAHRGAPITRAQAFVEYEHLADQYVAHAQTREGFVAVVGQCLWG